MEDIIILDHGFDIAEAENVYCCDSAAAPTDSGA